MIVVYLMLTNEDKDIDFVTMGLAIIKDFMWQFDFKGEPHLLLYVYVIMLIILFGSMMVFMLYFLFVKGYLGTLAYPSYVDTTKRNAKPELRNPTKFALYYGVYVMIIYTFFLILFSFYHLSGSKMLFTCIFLIVTFMMFMMLIVKYTLERSAWRIVVLWFVFFVWFVVYYLMLGYL